MDFVVARYNGGDGGLVVTIKTYKAPVISFACKSSPPTYQLSRSLQDGGLCHQMNVTAVKRSRSNNMQDMQLQFQLHNCSTCYSSLSACTTTAAGLAILFYNLPTKVIFINLNSLTTNVLILQNISLSFLSFYKR